MQRVDSPFGYRSQTPAMIFVYDPHETIRKVEKRVQTTEFEENLFSSSLGSRRISSSDGLANPFHHGWRSASMENSNEISLACQIWCEQSFNFVQKTRGKIDAISWWEMTCSLLRIFEKMKILTEFGSTILNWCAKYNRANFLF